MSTPELHHVQCLGPAGLHRMAYWQWGQVDNPHVVLCVHGLTRQGRDFDALAQVLSQRYRVVCPDVAGRGESEWLAHPAGYAVPHYVSNMVTLLARLQATTLDWVGTSMGGLIGMGMAALPRNPIRRLVLNDVGPRLDYAALARIGAYVGADVSWPSFEKAAEGLRLISEGFGPHTTEQWDALCRPQLRLCDDGRWRTRYDPGIAVAFQGLTPETAQAGEAALWAAYDVIRAPTLVLRGAQSDLLSPATAQAMTERGPRAQVVTFEGVGHAPTLVSADQVQVVERFLSEP